jgi:hypothetical protein
MKMALLIAVAAYWYPTFARPNVVFVELYDAAVLDWLPKPELSAPISPIRFSASRKRQGHWTPPECNLAEEGPRAGAQSYLSLNQASA